MKRKLPILISLMLALVFVLAACGGLGSVPVKGKQDTDYIVLSNGGSAVQYGNYVYFINGYRGYEDTNGKNNVFNEVEKGAIYRAELNGSVVADRKYTFSFGDVYKKSFQPARNLATDNNFVTTTKSILKGYEVDAEGAYLKENDEYIEIREDVEYANVQLIGPKVIGTSGYAEGGIFIFDDYIFYASPNNKKNKSGDVQTQKTDFYRAKLDGSKTELIYTSDNDTTGSSYMFYKYNGAYYLVVLDGTNLKSVKMDKKIRDAVTIGENVSQAYLPNKGSYYKGMPENTVEDFIFFLRSPSDKDPSRQGNVLEMKRPDGSSSYVISANGKSASIEGTDNGLFFYRMNGMVIYSNYAEVVNGTIGTSNPLPANVVKKGGMLDTDVSEYSWIKCVNPNPLNADDVYIIASLDNVLYIIDRADNHRVLHNSQATFVANRGRMLYFTAGTEAGDGDNVVNKLFQIDMLQEGAKAEGILVTDTVSSLVTFKYDILPDFVAYFANIDPEASNYMFFKELADGSADGVFVGYRTSADTTPEEDLYPDED